MESVEVTRDAVLGMSGPTFYYGQVRTEIFEFHHHCLTFTRTKTLLRRSQKKIFRGQQLKRNEFFNVKKLVIHKYPLFN